VTAYHASFLVGLALAFAVSSAITIALLAWAARHAPGDLLDDSPDAPEPYTPVIDVRARQYFYDRDGRLVEVLDINPGATHARARASERERERANERSRPRHDGDFPRRRSVHPAT
jgi:hypothetical protein